MHKHEKILRIEIKLQECIRITDHVWFIFAYSYSPFFPRVLKGLKPSTWTMVNVILTCSYIVGYSNACETGHSQESEKKSKAPWEKI